MFFCTFTLFPLRDSMEVWKMSLFLVGILGSWSFVLGAQLKAGSSMLESPSRYGSSVLRFRSTGEQSGTKISLFPATIPAPRNLTLLNSGVDTDGKAYLQISWLPAISLNSQGQEDRTPVDRYRITWHDHLNPKEEFRKTINGDLTSYTIEHLLTNVQVFIDVQAFRWIDDRKVRSSKISIVIRTPSRKSAADIQADMPRPVPDPTASESNVTIQNIFFQNGLLKANLSWNDLSSGKDSNTIFILRWYPKVCLGDERRFSKEHILIKPLVMATSLNNAVIHDLSFNCRYAVAIYQRDSGGANIGTSTFSQTEKLRAIRHFVTPICQEVTVLGSLFPNCPNLAPRVPSTPQNLSCIFLVQQAEISATCSWEPPLESDQLITAYRALYARKLPITQSDSVLVLDRNNYVMKVLDEDELSFSVANLEEETEYLVHVQAVSLAGFGAIAQLDFITPKLGQADIPFSGQKHQRSFQRDFSEVASNNAQGNFPTLFLILVCLCNFLWFSSSFNFVSCKHISYLIL